MPTKVLTQHNDNGRSGTNLEETILNTSNVNVNQFGKLFSHAVQGQIYAQPLFVPDVEIGRKRQDIVIVATMENRVYAFPADHGGDPLWVFPKKDDKPIPAVPARFFSNEYRDVSSLPDDRGNAAKNAARIGILSTPVVDAQIDGTGASATTGKLYFVLFTSDLDFSKPNLQLQQDGRQFRYQLHALDVATGLPARDPADIRGDYPGKGYSNPNAKAFDKNKTPLRVVNGVTMITQKFRVGVNDRTGSTGQDKPFSVEDGRNSRVIFNPMQHLQRPGLLLHDGVLYIAFGAHADLDPYHGWVFAYDANTFERRGVFCSTPNGARAGIWQAAEGLVVDSTGSIYLGTGNGDMNGGSTPNLGESYLRLNLSHDGLALTGWVSVHPSSTNPLEDEDLGAASPTLLPDGLLVGGGKDGNFYLLDPAKLGTSGRPEAIVQQFLASMGSGSRKTNTHHIHGSPVAYQISDTEVLIYVWGENDIIRVYRYDPRQQHRFPNQPNDQNAPVARGNVYASNDVEARNGMPGGMLSLSAKEKEAGTAILWASFPPFESANLKVVDGELIAYDATQFDRHGRVVAIWRSHQNPRRDEKDSQGNDIRGFAKFCCPTVAGGRVYQATFSNRVNVYGVLEPAKRDGGYNLRFGGNIGLTLNGSARALTEEPRGDLIPIRITGQHPFNAGSFFHSERVDVSHFSTTFRFRIGHQGEGVRGDGFTFTIQGEGPRALGGPGGGLGYDIDTLDPLDPGKVTKSVALKFDLLNNQGAKQSVIGLLFNDADLHSGNELEAVVTYDGDRLVVKVRDQQKEHTETFDKSAMNNKDIRAITGQMAFVGFTAGTGTSAAAHDILSWSYTT